MEKPNLTSKTHPRAPEVIHFWNKLVSASDYGNKETRKLLKIKWLSEDSINQIMAARTLAKLGHGYKKEVIRRSGERYFDHPSGVALLLLLELWETDPDTLAAAQLHDVLEDVKIDLLEMENLIKRVASHETFHITEMVTNPEKTWDEKKDKQIKARHYHLISQDEKASRLKIADRMYNLRSLEIHHLDESELTEKHLRKAEEQIEETRKYILPIAEKFGLGPKLLADIEKVEKRASEVRLIFVQKKTKEAAKI